MRLADIKPGPGQVGILRERMGDEIRETFYMPLHGEARFSPHYIRAIRLRTAQGTPGQKPRFDTGPVTDETEVDGRIPVETDSVLFP